MYVCICHAVTDTQIHRAVDTGADSLEQIGRTTRAGTSCGTCHDHIDEIVEARCGSCPLTRLVA
ncbi:bacterioferritin-associated ferredoxin [uncultured Jatrophihabitans sp.]|uniref:(2Fe-2S)-binding protein n=1 Tax=uncultured Jatrophihabitans sp. TaxID=1610747 RepID=UPI0035CAA180